MAEVVIYTTMLCLHCFRAKRLLKAKGVPFAERDVTLNWGKRREMIGRAGGRRTVPQIFINGTHIGGCDELLALEHAGKLDSMLEVA
ncbi:MAG: glutaredoxin 3 [Alphaproteobacteria bacterium]